MTGLTASPLDSLFARVMLVQTALLLLALLMFAGLMGVERHIMLAPLQARTWAPRVQAALSGAGAALDPDLASAYRMVVSPVRPSHLWLQVTDFSPFAEVKAELLQHGVRAGALYLDWQDGQLMVWLEALQPAGPPLWVRGGALDHLPRWTSRVSVGLALLLVVHLIVGWLFVRRITAPIVRLRRLMHRHAQPGQVAAGDAPAGPGRGASAEIRAMHDDYLRLIAELQRHDRERALLLAGVSHDLRSPLGRIRLAAEMLPERDDTRRGVATITRNVDHADALVGSFVDFVRAGNLPMDEAVDVAAALRRVVAGFQRPGSELQVQAPARLVVGASNALLIDRLAFNLVDNALQYGRLPVRVAAFEQTGALVIDVVDRGVGIDATGGEPLWDAFARGAGSRGQPGLGLGLAVVKQVVDRFGGSVNWSLGPDGHTVRVVLPR